MDNIILCLFVCLIIPISMSMYVLKDKSRYLILFVIFGMLACLVAGETNNLMQLLTGFDTYDMTTAITPVVEEALKSIPILILFFAFKPNRQFVLESSIMVGIGFSLLENGFILLSNANTITFTFALIRGLGSAMLHVVTAVSVGLGISMFGNRKKMVFTGTYATLLGAMVFHGIYNMFVQSEKFMYFGIILPMVVFIAFAIIIRKHIMMSIK